MRNEWGFEFQAVDVLKAAGQRLEIHEGRLTYWLEEQTRAEKDLRENGIDIQEVVNTATRYNNSYQNQPMLDQEKVKKAGDAQAKVNEHRGLRDRYESWVRALQRAAPSRILILDIEDIRFFGL